MVCNSCQIVGGHSCQRYSRKLWCSWWRSRQTRQVDITAMCCTIKWTDDTSCIHQHCRVRSLQATCPYSSHHFAAVAVSLKKLKWFIFKISSYGPNILKYSFEVLSGKQNRKFDFYCFQRHKNNSFDVTLLELYAPIWTRAISMSAAKRDRD